MEKRLNIFPVVDWLGSYRKEWLRFDVVAGLTTAAVVIPKAMAYAAIAGLPLVVGLYSSLVMLVVYAALGTSRLLSVTTSSTIAILTAGILDEVAPGGDPAQLLAASATLSLLVGVFLLLAGVLRLGVVADLISDPVLTGFKAGIGLVIVLDQLPKLFGVHISKAGFFRDLISIVQHLPESSLPTLALALVMLALMLGIEHFAPKLPAPLITVAVGIALAAFAGLDRWGISLVGAVQPGLPGAALPDLSLAGQMWPAALGIALMSFVETAAAGRAFVHKGTPQPDANRELMATGMGNLVGGFFHIMPGGGGTSQTAVNMGAGARTQLSGVVAAAVIVATLLFLAPLFGMMPNATLAAVVIIASIGLVSPAEFRSILKVRTMEFSWALLAAFGVMVLGTLKGLLVAVLASLVNLMIRANRHPVAELGRKPGTNVFRPLSAEHPEDETFAGLLLLRPEGAIHFGNAQRLGSMMRNMIARSAPRVLALDLSAVHELEYTALRMMTDGEERLREEGTMLWLVAMNPEVVKVVRLSPLWERLGRERMFLNMEQAVEKFQQQTGISAQAAAGRREAEQC
ncbi:SulP family inorganic anion transporter [Geomonas sp.]|uniref:SulP family inorganic anion transporter n=1 Tax=Geomonas sp. TaxID=2651584 RepID=UPI002B49BB84|nr:SulP family inorganic anion transporter [Geomonas sp.]HJV34258.1 SulP family inorganic anion transporter [Geomonas sp.]